VVYPENVLGMSGKFLWDNLLSPVANFSGKKILDALFYSKSVPQSLPPQLLEASYAPASDVFFSLAYHLKSLHFRIILQIKYQTYFLSLFAA
jgi:hypothetical protein